uniref:Uncharacterized protein n=1 Tax=Utricularia reniformis TaxID=192314 RepID=A0A1Y0B0D0_9LAMI|nr:hypothetical protein AEK19_MT0582 [Utricularia reniformis]ART30838.1 hypothetical protein AEK19_MT0582 [Utricularia reniformis]
MFREFTQDHFTQRQKGSQGTHTRGLIVSFSVVASDRPLIKYSTRLLYAFQGSERTPCLHSRSPGLQRNRKGPRFLPPLGPFFYIDYCRFKYLD